jgi:hypothetical protein
MFIIRVLVGLLVLTLGRQLFWILIAGLGFIFGITYGAQYYAGQPQWLILVVGLAAGLVGALFAVFLQRLAVAVAGFGAGWYLTTGFLDLTSIGPGLLTWIILGAGGIIGLFLVIFLFDWSLIILSALTGALIIIRSVTYGNQFETILFIFLVLIGITVQFLLWQQERESE